MSEPTSTRVNAAMNLIVATVLRSMRKTIDHLIRVHETAINPHPQYRLRVREIDNSPSGLANVLIFPNGSVTFPEDMSDTAVITTGGALTVREIDGEPTGTPSILELPDDCLEYPEDAPGVARVTAAALSAALGVGLEPVLFSFAVNGTQGFIADYDATYSATAGGTGGGTFAYAINGSSDTPPLVVEAGDAVTVTLSGATIGAGEVRLLTLGRTA